MSRREWGKTFKINNNILESTQVSLNSENSNELTNFKIYPNPVNGILNVAFENLKVPSTIKIINLSGMEVNSFKVDAGVENFQINTSDYDAGVYFLNLSNEFLNQKTKFIKIKN
ncbi:MAG: T9SS type A sorting domain-containing protein [Saprospiraceae bacterium]|nr:T9SS type A sorting domain-containing protein [Saprospiraceae bacterium]